MKPTTERRSRGIGTDPREWPAMRLTFLGHAGWGPGQLDGELERGDWILEPAKLVDAFSAEAITLWSAVLTRKGGSYALLARMPADPSTN